MSLIARGRHLLCNGSITKHINSPAVASTSHTLSVTRHFAQTATSESEGKAGETDQRRPPSERTRRLVDEMSGLTLAEANQLSSIMMEKFCFQMMKRLTMKERFEIMARFQSAKAEAGTAAKEEKKAEKTTFELKMEAYETASKLKIIKEIRSFMTLGLKEAKDLVEKTPAVLKKGVSKEEGEQIIEKMKALGATVVMDRDGNTSEATTTTSLVRDRGDKISDDIPDATVNAGPCNVKMKNFQAAQDKKQGICVEVED